MLTVGSVFSGIGGFDLGLERAGMRTVWFCEQDEFCRAVLAKHWPGVPCYPDVRALVADTDTGGLTLDGERNGGAPGPRLETSQRDDTDGRDAAGELLPVPVPYVDVLCGGFPCQDLSVAGKGAGIDGQRSGLWGEYARLIRELRPRYVVVENVAALLGRGLGRVLGDLAACGYDAEWDCISASAVGAPHRRDRLWIVAYPQRGELRPQPGRRDGEDGSGAPLAAVDGEARPVVDPSRDAEAGPTPQPGTVGERARPSGESAGAVAYPDGERGDGPGQLEPGGRQPTNGSSTRGVGHSDGASEDSHAAEGSSRQAASEQGWRESESRMGHLAHGISEGLGGHWMTEPADVSRVSTGVPQRVDKLAALGNALVPQIAEWLGRRIVEAEEQLT